MPKVYNNLSTAKVLTLEFVQGVKISNVEAVEAAGLDRKEIASTALRALVKMLLIDGFFHADPHPGNVLVNLETGDVTFLDTGMVGELDLQQRINLIQLLIAIRQVDIPGMAQIMKNMSVPFIKNVDEKAYFRDFERTVGRYFYAGTTAGFGEIVSTMLNLLREHGLRLNPNLTMAIKALMQAEAIATALAPEGGMLAEGVQIIQEQAMQVITAERVIEEGRKQLLLAGRELVKQIPDLSMATTKWLSMYKKGRLEVTVDTSEVAKEVDKLGRFGRQVVIAILLMGMLIGSAIATAAISFADPVDEIWGFIYDISYIAFVFSMVLTVFIVLRLIWQWIRGDRSEKD